MSARVLYISYDGLMEPLGQSQVLQYLLLLAKEHSIYLVTYEKPVDLGNRTALEVASSRVREAGIKWVRLRYHKRPTLLATGFDLAVGAALCCWLAVRYRIQIIHARSYVPSVIAWLLKGLNRVRFVFDMRGFWADERVDGGLWKREWRIYRVAKWFERRFLQSADFTVSLTYAGLEEIRKFPFLRKREIPSAVIPTCANLEMFRPPDFDFRKRFRQDSLVVGFVGNLGTWYLLDPMLESFEAIRRRRPQTRLIVLNIGEHAVIRERMSALGIPQELAEIKSVSFREMPRELARIDVGLFVIKPLFSKAGSAPTKMAELLGCGIPCLSNAGVGDVERILETERVGVAMKGTSPADIDEATERFLKLLEDPELRQRCVKVARAHFSVEDGARAYSRIYDTLASRLPASTFQ
jgi:glycosyltransferase involved in cell wall biosynthesis